MAITDIDVERGPLSDGYYLILSFDPRNAQLAVFGEYSFAPGNVAEAVDEAKQAAEQAAARGLPLQYLVVQAVTKYGYRPA